MATSAGYRQWPAPARNLAVGIDAAVTAARSGDAESFDDSLVDLTRTDREQLGVLLGDVTCALIEHAHPDGLDSDDAEEMLRSCVRSAAPWYRPLDTDALIRALTGTLGIGDADASDEVTGRSASDGARGHDGADGSASSDGSEDLPRPDPAAVLAHGVLLVADQLHILGLELTPILDSALRDLMRAQTMELP